MHTETEPNTAMLPSISGDQQSRLTPFIQSFISDFMKQEFNSPAFHARVDSLTALGAREIAAAAAHSNTFLDRPMQALDGNNSVGNNLAALRSTIENLDPERDGDFTQRRLIFGFIPWGTRAARIKTYFDGYASAQSHLATILSNLAESKAGLISDNIAIDSERENLWEALGRIEQMIFVAREIDHQLSHEADRLAQSSDSTESDIRKAGVLRETAIFYTRQRTIDLQTQLAVTAQGYLVLDLVKKNNIETIKGIDRASTTTVAALRTAVIVAQALSAQKLVIDQISAINTSTISMVDSTGGYMRSQSAAIHKQAVSATIPLETLKKAFANVYATIDDIDRFKETALATMETSINAISEEIDSSKKFILNNREDVVADGARALSKGAITSQLGNWLASARAEPSSEV